MMPRLGIRLQILLALLVLLVLAFVPLFAAVVSLTRISLQNVREASARSVGHAIAAQVDEARSGRTSTELATLLESEIRTGGVAALAVYDDRGAIALRVGEPEIAATLPERLPGNAEEARHITTQRGAAIEVVVPSPKGAVMAVLRSGEENQKGAPLLRWLALYTGLFAFALLTFAYLSLTRLIVRPLDRISEAARRVADGARRLEVPEDGPSELIDLARSVSSMTSKLRADEQRMRDQIEELERRAEKLREAQDRLIRSERMASVGRLSAGLAHEIGNPIAAMLGLEDLLLEGGLSDAEQRDFLTRIRRETERIHLILRDLLDFARAKEHPTLGGAEPGDVAKAVLDVAALVRPQRSFRDLTLDIEVEPGLPAVLLGHERIMQVLLNLLLNAADATPPSGTVRLRAKRTASGVRLIVEDTGNGVAPAIRERLFEPFVSTKEVGKGTGLGLAVCRGLVESASGAIRLDESYTRGARFVIDLPAAREP